MSPRGLGRARGAGAGAGARRSDDERPRRDARERALRLLAVRSRSRGELERRLLQAGFDREEVHEALARLESAELLDDERFAREMAESRFRRLTGKQAVETALVAGGVTRETARQAVQEFEEGEEARAEQLARLRAARLRSLPPPVARRRLYSLLLRRGFEASLAAEAAARALEEDPADA